MPVPVVTDWSGQSCACSHCVVNRRLHRFERSRMTPEQWQQVRDVLHGAIQLRANQRSAYLDVHCAGDPALRREVEQLLAAEGNVPISFLESPALEQLPPQTESKLSGTVLAAGTKLGPYVVQGLIGAGGMGEVYKARDTRLNRTVALEVLPQSLSADPFRRSALSGRREQSPPYSTQISAHFLTLARR